MALKFNPFSGTLDFVGSGGGGGGTPTIETFTGPASSLTLGISPSLVLVLKNGVQQHSVAGVPNEGEYKRVGNTVTITVDATSIVDVYEWA